MKAKELVEKCLALAEHHTKARTAVAVVKFHLKDISQNKQVGSLKIIRLRVIMSCTIVQLREASFKKKAQPYTIAYSLCMRPFVLTSINA